MRSLVGGTHRAFPPRFFCDSSNYIAQILRKYPNLFPKYLHSIESSVTSENAAARGKQGTCRCIPRSCIFRMLVIVNYELHCTKHRSKPWWDHGCEPGLQYLCNHHSFVNSSNLPSLGSTKAKRPNRLITLKLCLTKKQAIFTDFCSVQNSPDVDAPGRAEGHFWPSRLWSCILFNFIEDKRKGVCFGNKNKVSWPNFPFLHTMYVTKYSPYFSNHLGSLLNGSGDWFQMQTRPHHLSQFSCNMQQSTEEETWYTRHNNQPVNWILTILIVQFMKQNIWVGLLNCWHWLINWWTN